MGRSILKEPFKQSRSGSMDDMWRSLFMAIGIMVIIVGLESMVIDSATLFAAAEANAVDLVDPTGPPAPATRVWSPGEAFPWIALAIGAVTIVYAFTLPKRFKRAEG